MRRQSSGVSQRSSPASSHAEKNWKYPAILMPRRVRTEQVCSICSVVTCFRTPASVRFDALSKPIVTSHTFAATMASASASGITSPRMLKLKNRSR